MIMSQYGITELCDAIVNLILFFQLTSRAGIYFSIEQSVFNAARGLSQTQSTMQTLHKMMWQVKLKQDLEIYAISQEQLASGPCNSRMAVHQIVIRFHGCMARCVCDCININARSMSCSACPKHKVSQACQLLSIAMFVVLCCVLRY